MHKSDRSYQRPMTPKLAFRRGKREREERPASKHQIRPGDGIWAGRRGVGRLDPRRENKKQGKSGDRERGRIEKVTEKNIGAQTEAARQSRATPPMTKQNEESTTCTWTGDHNRHAQRPDDGGGWDARSWTGARCFECVPSTGVRRHRFVGDPPQRTFSLQLGWLLGVLQWWVRWRE